MSEEQTEPKQKQLFTVFCNASGWLPEHGPEPGIFLDKPAGHKCIWSVKWGSAFGLVLPGDLLDLSDATPVQLIHEASDVSQRGNTEIGKVLMSVNEENHWQTLAHLRALLEQERHYYPEYVHDTLPPPRARLGILKVRDGWGTPKEVFQKALEV